MDRGLKKTAPRYRRLAPEDGVERLIVILLFAVSAIGIYTLTGSLLAALFIGLLVGSVAVGTVAVL
ncbi:hypothetical protein DFR75_1012389 [Nocardia ignorata]|uniref:Uncharacterized protein n=1 Tax=Nocardia ignorata TaxID=145285 RepID=A0A4R6PXU1_NOCIG|nr:hypothetical protein DFR75_1012389 [Nocardia ignorata]